MRVLLDTSYLYKLMIARGQFSETERKYFEKHGTRLYVSAVSIWEMRLKYHSFHPSGERKSPFDPNDVIAVLKQHAVSLMPMTESHAARELDPPLGHKDPFDEILLVQAQEEDCKFLTTDWRLIGHPLAITL